MQCRHNKSDASHAQALKDDKIKCKHCRMNGLEQCFGCMPLKSTRCQETNGLMLMYFNELVNENPYWATKLFMKLASSRN